MYNHFVPEFRFFHPVEVRYGDLDPQGHVNNARYLTYMEQARIAYFLALGLWDGRSFLDIGFILADTQITFKSPVYFNQDVQVGVRVSHMKQKSLTMEYRIEDGHDHKILAIGSSVLVVFDYRNHKTLPIPDDWRNIVENYEKGSDQ